MHGTGHFLCGSTRSYQPRFAADCAADCDATLIFLPPGRELALGRAGRYKFVGCLHRLMSEMKDYP